MATCKNCIGYEYCNPQPKNPRKVEKWCDRFKNKADFVEVVRCKDCKHRYSSEYCECRDENAYCSDGERKEP